MGNRICTTNNVEVGGDIITCPNAQWINKELLKNSQQHKEFYEKLENTKLSNALLSQSLKTVERKVDDVAENVKILVEKPSKRWDSMVSTIIAAITTGIVGAILGMILAKGGI